jgi:hypothetical protein
MIRVAIVGKIVGAMVVAMTLAAPVLNRPTLNLSQTW